METPKKDFVLLTILLLVRLSSLFFVQTIYKRLLYKRFLWIKKKETNFKFTLESNQVIQVNEHLLMMFSFSYNTVLIFFKITHFSVEVRSAIFTQFGIVVQVTLKGKHISFQEIKSKTLSLGVSNIGDKAIEILCLIYSSVGYLCIDLLPVVFHNFIFLQFLIQFIKFEISDYTLIMFNY